jgi:hypothetical protein
MEWMLQVVDEIDDAIGALRLWSVGLAAEIGLMLAACLGIGAMGAAVAGGADLLLIGAAAAMLGWAAVLKIQGSRLTTTR